MAYKHVIRAKTKNLFDISKADIISKDYCFTLNQGAGSNFYVMTVKPGITYTVSYERFIKSDDTYAPSTLELSIQTGNRYTDGTQLFIVLGGGERGVWITRSRQFTVPSGINQVTFSGLRDRFLYRNFMVQEGSTPTPYTPYNYLQSNKRMIKVSDVCQLLPISDKEDGVSAGVTFTNNHNGTWTVSGTSTAAYSYYNLFRNIPLRQGHIYLNASSFGNAPQTYVEIKWINKDGVVQWSVNPYTADENSKCDIGLIKLKGDVDTVVLGPQLFDLTEMFGAGHEPATVAEFRQRFPNEYYPYSPQCWLTSYKSAVVCKTKNLFDVNNAAPYTFTNDNPPSNRISLKDGIYTTTYNNYNVGSGLRIKDGLVLSPGTYTLSLSVITVGETTPITALTYGFRLYKSDGTKSVITTYTEAFSSRRSHAFTIPSDCTDIRLYLAPHCDSGQEYVYISLKDIQIEKGSTATSYVPYQHL